MQVHANHGIDIFSQMEAFFSFGSVWRFSGITCGSVWFVVNKSLRALFNVSVARSLQEAHQVADRDLSCHVT